MFVFVQLPLKTIFNTPKGSLICRYVLFYDEVLFFLEELSMPYICLVRSDIPPSVLQILDLKPNTSQRSFPYDPPGQTKYSSNSPQTTNYTNSVNTYPLRAAQTVTVVATIALADKLGIDTVATAFTAAGETYTAAAADGGAYPNFTFTRTGGDAVATAGSLATVINTNSRAVTASAVGAVVTLTAKVAGALGNTVDLAALVESGGAGTAFTLGGATLAGGTNGDPKTLEPITGLTAYLLDNVCNAFLSIGAGGTLQTSPLTPLEASQIASDLQSKMAAGTALTLANINAAINSPATVAQSDLNGAGALSNSTGAVLDILKLLSGESYTYPTNTSIGQLVANVFRFDIAVAGAFAAGSRVRYTENTGALQISLGSGALSKFIDPSFTYLGTAGRALVVYDDDGTLLG